MSQDTKIEWADDSVSFWWGCTKVNEACRFCYADRLSKRSGSFWGPRAPRLFIKSAATEVARLNRKAKRDAVPRVVFINSMSDFFEEHDGPLLSRAGNRLYRFEGMLKEDLSSNAQIILPPATIDDLRREAFELFDGCPWLRFLLLTKRPENIGRMWVSRIELQTDLNEIEYRHNVWLGTSISDQETADRNVPLLLKSSGLSPVSFLSAEPLLGPIDLARINHPMSSLFPECAATFNCLTMEASGHGEVYGKRGSQGIVDGRPIDWLICGCESGPKRRPMELDWARRLVDQCRAAGVAVFVKQLPINGRVSHEPEEWPADLRVREWPVTAEVARER